MPPTATRTRASRTRVLAGAAAAVLTLALTACSDDGTSGSSDGSGASGSDTPPAAETLDVEVKGNDVTPVAEQIDLALGQELKIRVRSDRAGELHVHSDPEHTYDFTSGTHTYTLTLDTPGSVDVEEHVSDSLVARVIVR